MKCFLDLAGVLTDFSKAAHGFFGLAYEPYPYPRGEWDYGAHLPIRKEAFLAALGEDFYANLPWMSDGSEILNLLECRFGSNNIFLLTQPIKTPGCIEGTIRWVRKHLPAYEDALIVTSMKHALASKDSILVDDKNENIDLFVEAGGHGVLVPRLWNRLQDKASNCLGVVEMQIIEICNEESQDPQI